MQDWQPIATAPKDGRSVLVHYINAFGSGRTVKAAYFEAGTLDMDDSVDDEAVDEEGKNVAAGWYADSDHHDPGYMPMPETPIAWMPLPDPLAPGVPHQEEI